MAPASLSADFADSRARSTPFVAAGLTGTRVEHTPARVTPITYEIRAIGESIGTIWDQDPNTPVQPHPMRLFAHALSTFVVVLAAGLTMIGMAPRLFGYESVVVTSGSMEPAIQIADVVITAPTDGEQLGPGAVINFERGDGTILHRVTDVLEDGYRTRGDANRTADSEIVEPAAITGVGVVVVPLVGLPRRWVDQGQWFHLGVTAFAVVAAVHMSRVRWVSGRRQKWAP